MSAIEDLVRQVADRETTPEEALSLFDGFTEDEKRRVLERLSALRSARPAETPAPSPSNTRLTGLMTNPGCGPRQLQFIERFIHDYALRTARSKQLAAHYRRFLVDQRTPANFNTLLKEIQYPLTVDWAQGAQIRDIDGNDYVDIASDFGVNLFGHKPQFLMEALENQLRKGLALSGRYHELAEAAQLFCEITGHDRVLFCQSGTEALMSALRLARAYTDRQIIATFGNAYHGHADIFLNPYTAGVSASAAGEAIVLEYGSPAALDAIAERSAELAAVIVEPVQSEALDVQPREFLQELRRITERAGIVLVLDEMITGLRAHPRGCQGLFGIDADLATYGKVLGGGITAGAVAGRTEIMAWADGGDWRYGDDSKPGPMTYMAGTHTQNPLKMAATLAILREIAARSPQLQTELTEKTARLVDCLNAIMADARAPIDVVRFASQFKFRFRSRRFTLAQALFQPLVNRYGVRYHMHGNCFLTAAHSDADLDRICRAVRSGVEDLVREGFFFEGSGLDGTEDGAAADDPPASRGRITPATRPSTDRADSRARGPVEHLSAKSPRRDPASCSEVEALAKPVKDIVADFLELAGDEFNEGDELSDLGADSIALAGILKVIATQLGTRLSLKKLKGGCSCRQLAEAVAAERGAAPRPAADASQAPALWPAASARPEALRPRAQSGAARSQDVAIVGMSGVFPEAPDLRAFWRNLLDGRRSVHPIGRRRADLPVWCDVRESGWGALLDDCQMFDPLFFRISPREARFIDPQERLLLMQCHAAMEDAGWAPRTLAGTRTGVFVGYEFADYARVVREFTARQSRLDPSLTALAAGSYYLANRISFTFDFKGPSEAINLNCASSAAAIVRAFQSLNRRESDLALAGGVCLNLDPTSFDPESPLLSPDGSSRVFAASANGFAKGEGCGVLALKRLEDAMEDGDAVYAVLKAASQGFRGQGRSISEVRTEAIAEVMQLAYDQAGIDPSTVGYVEVDGYCTLEGDTAEYEAVRAVVGEASSEPACAIGSLKPNIGNLEPASGVAAVAKVALLLSSGAAPPTLLDGTPNPAIIEGAARGGPSVLVAETGLSRLRRRGAPRARAGVNSSSNTGLNIHLVLEEAPLRVEAREPVRGPHVFVLSSRTAEGLAAYVRDWLDFLDANQNLDLARATYTLQTGRDTFAHRLACVVSGVDELRAGLRSVLNCHPDSHCFTGVAGGSARADLPPGSPTPEVIANAWATGASVDWLAWHGANPPGPLQQLPTYPFALRALWLEEPGNETAPSDDEPELAAANAQSPSSEILAENSAARRAIVMLVDGLRQLVAAFLDLAADDEFDDTAPFTDMGLTSLSIVHFVDEINAKFLLDLPETTPFDYPDLHSLAVYLTELIPPERIAEVLRVAPTPKPGATL